MKGAETVITLKGKGVCPGIAIGRISYFDKTALNVKRINVDDTNAELKRVETAKETAREQLSKLYDKALIEVGEDNANIFEIHRALLDDLDYNNAITNIITTQNVNAEYAVAVAADNFAMMLSSMADDYMRARSADVRDISDRMIRCLNGCSETISGSGKRIVCAFDLAPSATVQMDKKGLLAFVTAAGSSTSHTAILARTLGIPAVVGVGRNLTSKFNGEMAAVDGTAGIIYIDPDEKTVAELKEKQAAEQHRKSIAEEQKGRATATRDGQKICLYANIGSLSDIDSVIENDAEGIGLMRSEFLYMEKHDFPSEEFQFESYKKILESMQGKRVIIRTLDIGADKNIDYFGFDKEENPALGYRSIRICLTRKDIFRTQLRALLRASAFGKLAVMFPMINSLTELHSAKDEVKRVMSELRSEGIDFDENIEIGIMVETPAAAMISDMLAAECDFFSIGTNDLTQFTLAIDRQNPNLEQFYDPYHPALKRLMKNVIDNAHFAGIWVGVCGELGSDPNMTEWFVRAGIDELSVSPSMVLEMRRKISETERGEAPSGSALHCN